MPKELTMVMVGDIILNDDDVDPLFNSTRAILAAADLVIGHVEVAHTLRGQESAIEVPSSGGDPRRLEALGRANFHVATLAANKIFDVGAAGVADTLEALHRQGIKTAGAGMNIAEARQPAILQREDTRFGILSYNCVGPRESWATTGKPGAAYVHCMTHYDSSYGTGGPARDIYTFADPKTLELMQKDIEKLRPTVDIVMVALHKGVLHTPAMVIDSERQVARAAIDAGADIVVGHHSHVLRGIEIYRNKPIFHGLCNFVCVTLALSVSAADNKSPERLAWAEKRRQIYGFVPDPDYPKYPFHPEAKNTMMAVCKVGKDGVHKSGFIPCWVKPSGEVEPLGPDDRGNAALAYMEQITRKSGFGTRFQWNEGIVEIS